ncbi:Plastid division protein pdv1 [Thalictrum thalictroides]|uniref:Plastid division protein pdv1 n=1 Tax=Thalictrum thalictroides TaxID=46969 RepID=A0A7J6W3J2_THATH|nr:Plastid division protein pdv1 [Thalictrum thalictroides]
MLEPEEIEAVLEKIWDIHDKLSDAIHSISRSHYLNTVKTIKNSEEIYFSTDKKKNNNKGSSGGGDDNGNGNGFVFMKDVRIDDEEVIAEAKSLNAIRTALENLEDQLEFFHTVQLQQRAERDAAIARLEQSRIVLAMRLADHHGRKYKVIEEALAFVGDVHNASRFISPEHLFESRSQSGEISKGHEEKRSSILMQVLVSSYTFAKRCLKLEQIGGLLGQTALVAVSMGALLHLHQVSSKTNFVMEVPQIKEDLYYGKSSSKNSSQGNISSSSGGVRNLDVLAARG